MPIVNRCKCVIIGDAGVGKTAIVKSLLGPPHMFPKKYIMTPGVEITTKSIRSVVNSDVILEYFIYDFSGRSMYSDYIRKLWSNNVTVVVGVFDVNREETFYTLSSMLTELLKSFSNPNDVIGVILGNKIDLIGRRCVKADDGHQLAKKYKMRYFDVSAKESKGVIEDAFLYLTSVWLDQKVFYSNSINNSNATGHGGSRRGDNYERNNSQLVNQSSTTSQQSNGSTGSTNNSNGIVRHYTNGNSINSNYPPNQAVA